LIPLRTADAKASAVLRFSPEAVARAGRQLDQGRGGEITNIAKLTNTA